MHQIRFRLGLGPRPRWGSSQRPQTLKLDLRGPTSKGREGKDRGGEGREGKGREKGGKEGKEEGEGG